MNNNKLVSVIISAFNSEETIDYSLQSIINQTYQNLEILIMDDCSTDNTFKILKKYENSLNNVRIFKNDVNIGLTRSLNKLIKYSNGHFIARHDTDDLSNVFRIEKQVSYLNSMDLDGCTSRAFVMNSNKKIPNLSFYFPINLVMKVKNPFIHGSLLIKKEALNLVNNYDEKFYYAQDYKLMRDLIDNNLKIKIMSEVLYSLNMQNNISSNKKIEQEFFANCVKKNVNPVEEL